MSALRSLFLRLGFLNVEAYLTSGNVVFDTAPVGVIGPLEAQISRHLKNSLEASRIWTFIRTPEEVARIVANVPFDPGDVNASGNSLFVMLLWEPPDDRTTRQLRIRRNDVDELRIIGREIYWLRRSGEGVAPPPSFAEILDVPVTVRSFNTMKSLADRYVDPSRARTRPKAPPDSTESERSRP